MSLESSLSFALSRFCSSDCHSPARRHSPSSPRAALRVSMRFVVNRTGSPSLVCFSMTLAKRSTSAPSFVLRSSSSSKSSKGSTTALR